MSIKKILAASMTAGIMLSFIPTTSLADYSGWKGTKYGWRYYTPGIGFIASSWKQIDGVWYFFDGEGYIVSGIENYKINNKYYSFTSSGACKNKEGISAPQSGWFPYTYFYIGKEGKRSRSVWQYFVDGKPYIGWKEIDGSWYYFDKSGIMCTEAEKIDNKIYQFNKSGQMITGWYYDGTAWVYARSSGSLYAGEWLSSGGKWYYFTTGGQMLASVDNFEINGIEYSFDSSGACINPNAKANTDKITGWHKKGNLNVRYGQSYDWYYYDEDGNLCTGWKNIGNKWYYFDSNGKMYSTRNAEIDGNTYSFGNNGEMQTGWYKTSLWQYSGSNGVMYKQRWLLSDGKWYYFDYYGHMVSDTPCYSIDGVEYAFDTSGACLNPDGSAYKYTGWVLSQSRWFYFGDDGTMYINKWLQSGGNWYYFNSAGIMIRGISLSIDGKTYDFDSDGICMNPNYPRI